MVVGVVLRKARSARIRAARAARRVVPALRWHGHWLPARLRRHHHPGVTVVIVNFNGEALLPVVVGAVRRFSPPAVRILVVDNDSTDGSRRWLAQREDVTTIRSRSNVGHGAALDRGFHAVRTDYAVALDSDAFPIHDRWLDVLIGPLGDGNVVCGADAYRGFAHPCALAMRTSEFARRRFSFRPRLDRRGKHGYLDVGEAISLALPGQVALVPMTSKHETGIGQVFGGAIFHNFYGTRAGVAGDALDSGIDRAAVASTWQWAVANYLGE